MRTKVASCIAAANGVPFAVAFALEEVDPCCVTVCGRQQAQCAATCCNLCPTPTALWLDSEDATYTVALSAVRRVQPCRWQDRAVAVVASALDTVFNS